MINGKVQKEMSAKQAVQLVASLAQAMNAIDPDPEIVQKMIGSPRFLQDRLRMLLENPVPEHNASNNTSWKLKSIIEGVRVPASAYEFEGSVLELHVKRTWREWKNPCLEAGVAYGYVANKSFAGVGELLRAAMQTEDDWNLERMIIDRDLCWDISQITAFLSDYVWEGNNPLNLHTDGGRNLFLITDVSGNPKMTFVDHQRHKGKSLWYGMYLYDLNSPDLVDKGHHVYFKNNPMGKSSG